MKNLIVPFIEQFTVNDDIEKVQMLLNALPKNQINNQLWPKFKNNLNTNFSIGHINDAILLTYEVNDDTIMVNTFETNGAVHKDNCVEFFVSFGEEKSYYNIEINCVGVCLIAYGEGRLNRNFITKQLVEKIRTYVTIKKVPEKSKVKYIWQITSIIPIDVFVYSNLKTLKQVTGFGNFFKCGDDLPQPHFYSWNMIESKTPDFHLPEFFGSLVFG
jgi:hypothetical protein